MAKMGRPGKLDKPQYTGVILEKKHRDLINLGKGDETVSEYIRECIIIRSSPKEGDGAEEEVRSLKEELLSQAKRLKQYEQVEQKRHKVNEEQLAYIVKGYERWAANTGLNCTSSRLAWAQASVKGFPISAEDALSYLQAEGYFSLE